MYDAPVMWVVCGFNSVRYSFAHKTEYAHKKGYKELRVSDKDIRYDAVIQNYIDK